MGLIRLVHNTMVAIMNHLIRKEIITAIDETDLLILLAT